MKNWATIAAGLLIGIIPAAALAAEWVDWADVEEIYPMDPGFSVVLSRSSSYNGSCYDRRLYRIQLGDPNYDAKVAALTAAFMGGKQVRVYVDSTLSGCGAAHIDRFRVRH